MEDKEHISHLLLKFSDELSVTEKEQFRQQLIFYVNDLLLHDFNKLIQLLYRVDVNEQKLRMMLHANQQTDAAVLITDLLIQRQEEKLKTKRSFRSKDDSTKNDTVDYDF